LPPCITLVCSAMKLRVGAAMEGDGVESVSTSEVVSVVGGAEEGWVGSTSDGAAGVVEGSEVETGSAPSPVSVAKLSGEMVALVSPVRSTEPPQPTSAEVITAMLTASLKKWCDMVNLLNHYEVLALV